MSSKLIKGRSLLNTENIENTSYTENIYHSFIVDNILFNIIKKVNIDKHGGEPREYDIKTNKNT